VKEHILEVRKHIPQEYCKKILTYFNEDLDEAKIGNEKVNKNTRNCSIKHLLGNDNSFGKKIVLNYIKLKVLEAANLYKQKNPFIYFSKITQLDLLEYEYNKYEAGYTFHVDFAESASKRALSISICLNNHFEGGEFLFNFKGEHVQYTQNVGDCLVFPSNFMFPHQVNKIKFGKRNALIGWVV
jgi:predicted 2-oxoglutarate/Fe(II)-dependent dioxygenase YbiX